MGLISLFFMTAAKSILLKGREYCRQMKLFININDSHTHISLCCLYQIFMGKVPAGCSNWYLFSIKIFYFLKIGYKTLT